MLTVEWTEILAYGLKSIVPAIIILVVGILLIAFLERQINRLMTRKLVPHSTISSVRLLLRWTIIALIVLASATVLGLKLPSIWAAVSTVLAMAAIGLFAGWSLISSMLAMFIILIWRPFKVGDGIEILPDGIQGKLEHIDTMFCRIRETDGSTLVISNSQMLQKMVRRRLS